VAVKAEVDELVAALPQLRQQRPEIARQVEDLTGVFNHALLANDVYADASNPQLLPAGYSRLSLPEMAAIKLSPKDLIVPESGYFAAIYKTPEGRYVVANRGTTGEEGSRLNGCPRAPTSSAPPRDRRSCKSRLAMASRCRTCCYRWRRRTPLRLPRRLKATSWDPMAVR
jgi:hypothetical protein